MAGEAVKAGDAVELAVLGGVAVFILVGLAVLVARGAVGDDGHAGDGGSALRFATFGIAGETAGEDYEIGHVTGPSVCQTGNHFRLANIQKKQGMGGLHRRAHSAQGKRLFKGWCGQAAQLPTRPEGKGVAGLS